MKSGFLYLTLAAMAAALSSPAMAEIGRIKSSLGQASVQRGAAQLAAATGQALEAGDWLETGTDGRISLTFVDNTRFAVGPDSRIALKAFAYDPTTQKGSFVARVERGTIAVVSGRITKTRCGGQAGPPCGMSIETPDSTLDINGTRFVLTVKRK
jgi:hypothetical protein